MLWLIYYITKSAIQGNTKRENKCNQPDLRPASHLPVPAFIPSALFRTRFDTCVLPWKGDPELEYAVSAVFAHFKLRILQRRFIYHFCMCSPYAWFLPISMIKCYYNNIIPSFCFSNNVLSRSNDQWVLWETAQPPVFGKGLYSYTYVYIDIKDFFPLLRSLFY